MTYRWWGRLCILLVLCGIVVGYKPALVTAQPQFFQTVSPKLELQVDASHTQVNPGGAFSYTLTVSYAGDVILPDLGIIITLPGGFVPVHITNLQDLGECHTLVMEGQIECQEVTLSHDMPWKMQVEVLVPIETPPDTYMSLVEIMSKSSGLSEFQTHTIVIQPLVTPTPAHCLPGVLCLSVTPPQSSQSATPRTSSLIDQVSTLLIQSGMPASAEASLVTDTQLSSSEMLVSPLQLKIESTQEEILLGNTVGYSFIYENTDASRSAQHVYISARIPTGAVFDAEASHVGWHCSELITHETLCEYYKNEVLSGELGRLELVLQVLHKMPDDGLLPSEMNIVADVLAHNMPGMQASHTSPVLFPHQASSMTLTTLESVRGVVAGQTLRYEVTIEVQGASAMRNVVFTNYLPEELELLSVKESLGGDSCYRVSDMFYGVECYIDVLAPNSVWVVTLEARVSPSTPVGRYQHTTRVIAENSYTTPTQDASIWVESHAPTVGSIQGLIFYDIDQDGMFSQLEASHLGGMYFLNNWQIYLYDQDWFLVDTMQTGDVTTAAGEVVSGEYRFTGVAQGRYYLCSERRQDWHLTWSLSLNGVSPAEWVREPIYEKCDVISVGAGQITTTPSLGAYRSPLQSIADVVY